MRVIYRCQNWKCQHTWAIDNPDYEPDGYKFDYNGACPRCGYGAPRKSEVRGTVTAKPCTAVCMGATSAECKCSCGGANHGRRFLQETIAA